MWMVIKIYNHLLSFFFPNYCYFCKKEGTSLCTSCVSMLTRSPDQPYPYITCFYSYKDKRLKQLIHAIKYFHRKDLIAPLIENIIKEITLRKSDYDALVPIPMPLLRKYTRGYNHAEAIAHVISKHSLIPVQKQLLHRKKTKKRQVLARSRHERLRNQLHTFSASPGVKGRRILLIDDVTTTGATLQEARKELLNFGASEVHALTLVH